MLVVSIMILLSMTVTTAIISAQVKQSSQKLNFEIAEEKAKHIAVEVTLILEKAMTKAKTLEMSFRHAKHEKIPRQRLDDMLIDAIHQNPNTFGTWMLWEPNAFDQLDADYANTDGHEQSGRVNSYWHWHEGTIINEPNTGWQTASWYNNPRNRAKETLEDPYFYQVSNQSQLLISTIQPILLNNEFLGVVGVDVDLNVLQQRISTIKFLEAGYAELIAFNGMYVAHSNPAFIGKVAPENIKQSIQQGELIQRLSLNQNNEEIYQVQVPINVGVTETPWALLINIPMHVIDRPGKDAQQIILLVLAISGFLMLGLVWFFIARGMAPLTSVTNQIKEITANTKGCIPNITNIEQGEISTLTHAFNDMIDALNESRQNLLTINNELEDRVDARTKQLEEALQQQKDIQEQLTETEKMASLGTLVAGVAHEINTPIGVALTGSSHLRDSTENLLAKHNAHTLSKSDFDAYIESTTKTCNIIESNIYRATSLISNFKMVAVDTSHEEERRVELSDYITNILESLQPSFKKHRVKLETQITPNTYAICDPGTLAHILSNTVMNSFLHAFSHTEPQNKTIKVSCYEHDNNIELRVEDNGMGMTPDVKDKIFEPFFTTRRGEGGSGLGMHIIYNMVLHKLNGTINVESSLHQGTLISITFPSNINEPSCISS